MKRSGYSLVEVVIAGALLAIGIAAAAMLAHVLVQNEEASLRVTRILNAQEQAGRLYHLGLSTTTITNILPEWCTNSSSPPAGSINLSFTTTTTNIAGVIAMEQALCTVRYRMGGQTTGTDTIRSNTVLLVRPTIR